MHQSCLKLASDYDSFIRKETQKELYHIAKYLYNNRKAEYTEEKLQQAIGAGKPIPTFPPWEDKQYFNQGVSQLQDSNIFGEYAMLNCRQYNYLNLLSPSALLEISIMDFTGYGSRRFGVSNPYQKLAHFLSTLLHMKGHKHVKGPMGYEEKIVPVYEFDSYIARVETGDKHGKCIRLILRGTVQVYNSPFYDLVSFRPMWLPNDLRAATMMFWQRLELNPSYVAPSREQIEMWRKQRQEKDNAAAAASAGVAPMKGILPG